MLRTTSPQVASVVSRLSFISRMVAARFDLSTPWNCKVCREVMRNVWLEYWSESRSSSRYWCGVTIPPGTRTRIIMMYFLPVLRKSRSSSW